MKSANHGHQYPHQAAPIFHAESNLADLAAKIAGLGPSGAELSPEALQDMLDRIAGAEAKIESLSETKADRDEVPAVVTTDGAAPDPRIAAMVAAHAKRLDAIEKAAKELGDAVAAAASKEEVDDVRLGVLQTAYALLLLAVGPRADSHTKRPPSRTSSRTTGGADGKAEGGAGAPGSGLPTGRARPASAVPPRAEDGASGGGAGQARTGDGGEGETPRGGSEAQDKTGETREGADGGGPLGADVAGKPGEPAEVLDVLEGLLDKGMVREKGDKAALRR